MTPSEEFIHRLQSLKEGSRSFLRCLAGRALNETLWGFDLFTGLWWPLRQQSRRAPRRETAWLVTKLYAAIGIPHIRRADGTAAPTLAHLLGYLEPRHDRDAQRFRARFEALLGSPLPALEPHLKWALGALAWALRQRRLRAEGLDWAQLLDDLSLWDRGLNPADSLQRQQLKAHMRLVPCTETHQTPQQLWACEYFHASRSQAQGADDAD
jgi:hypothetical protein